MFRKRILDFTNYINYMMPNQDLLDKYWNYHQKRITESFKLGILLGISMGFWGFFLSLINLYTNNFVDALYINFGYVVISIVFIYLFTKFHLNGFLLILKQKSELKIDININYKRILLIDKFIFHSLKWFIIVIMSLIIPGLIWYLVGTLFKLDFINNTSHYYNYLFIVYYIAWFGSVVFLELIDFNSLYKRYFINK